MGWKHWTMIQLRQNRITWQEMYHAIQNSVQFKTYDLFLDFSFNIFRLVDGR